MKFAARLFFNLGVFQLTLAAIGKIVEVTLHMTPHMQLSPNAYEFLFAYSICAFLASIAASQQTRNE
jgi:hypothetical protein